jgi:DNA-binding GntR family transcriptional regulator
MNTPSTPLHAVRPISLPEQIYTQLRAAILSGELAAGQRILEMDIANRTGASQASVREALARLESEGLVERRARSGTFVTQAGEDEIRELFYIRAQVEAFAIRRLARRLTPQQYDELADLVQQMYTAAQAGDMLTLGELDMAFHRLIVSASGSGALLRAWAPLYSPIQRYVTQRHPHFFPDLGEVARLHEPILAVLRTGDEQQAAEVIQQHILLTVAEVKSRA